MGSDKCMNWALENDELGDWLGEEPQLSGSGDCLCAAVDA